MSDEPDQPDDDPISDEAIQGEEHPANDESVQAEECQPSDGNSVSSSKIDAILEVAKQDESCTKSPSTEVSDESELDPRLGLGGSFPPDFPFPYLTQLCDTLTGQIDGEWHDNQKNSELRVRFAWIWLAVVGVWLGCCLVIVCINMYLQKPPPEGALTNWYGYVPRGLSDTVIVALLTTSMANVLTLAVIVFKFLFPEKRDGHFKGLVDLARVLVEVLNEMKNHDKPQVTRDSGTTPEISEGSS